MACPLWTGDVKGRHAGMPVKRAVGLHILGCIPEGRVIHGVNGHTTVVTPPVEIDTLRTGPGNDDIFALHLIERVRAAPACKLDLWMKGGAGYAVVERRASGL